MSRFILIPTVILAAVYNLLPLAMGSTGGAMMILLILMPVVTLIASGFVGLKRGFTWLWPVLAGVLFIPAIFLYMNSSAWVYVPGFAVLALIGMWIGNLIRQGDKDHE